MKKKGHYDIPVLLIIFRRPDTAVQVVDAIAKVKPKRLYISQDGPRNKREEKLVIATRKAVLSKINWDCDLRTRFHDRNLGLIKHNPGALDWFFETEEMGIYLEDDTVPSRQFFVFQRELLKKFRENRKIFAIGGVNRFPKLKRTRYSYFLTQIVGCWGLGLWKRSWLLYDVKPKGLKSFVYREYKDFIFSRRYFARLKVFLGLIKKGKLSSWVFQLTYAALKNRMYALVPSKNLVNNVGINNNATNIFISKYDLPIDKSRVEKIIHPEKLIYSKTRDIRFFAKMYPYTYLRLFLNLMFYSLPDSIRMKVMAFLHR